MSFEMIQFESQNDVWTITINRPQALNALNSRVLKEISEALSLLEKKDFAQAKCLIVTGAGEKAFVAGADIREMNELNDEGGKKFAREGQQLFRRFEKLNIPVIAAVNGFALGGGLELALACDFIIASENAKLGLPEVSLGLIPGFGGTVRLSRVVGLNRAREMILTGDMLTANEAFQCGLVNKVVTLSELKATVHKIAGQIAVRGPLAVKAAKKSVLDTFDLNIDEALLREADYFSEMFATKDFVEGTTAFLDKRKPAFKGN